MTRDKKQYLSPLLAAIHETAEDLRNAGVMDKRTMREFDKLCLNPVPHANNGSKLSAE